MDRGRRVHFHNDFLGLFPSEYVMASTVGGLGFLVLACSSRLGLSRQARGIWIVTASLHALCGVVTALRYLAQGQDHIARMGVIFHAPFVYWALAIALDEGRMVVHLLAQGCLAAACITFNQHVMLQRALAECVPALLRRASFWFNIVLAAGICADYWQSLWRARRLLNEDAQRHGAIWSKVSTEEPEALATLQREAERLDPSAVQRGRRWPLCSRRLGTYLRQETGSLDQLFAQARVRGKGGTQGQREPQGGTEGRTVIERGRGREVGGGGGGGQEGGNELQQSGFAIADDADFFLAPFAEAVEEQPLVRRR